MNAVFTRERESSILLAHSFLKSLPEEFQLRSMASGKALIDPSLPVEKVLDEIGNHTIFVESRNCRSSDFILGLAGSKAIVLLEFSPGRVSLQVFMDSMSATAELKRMMEGLAKYKFENKEENGVWVDFSHLGDHGVVRLTEFLRCPTWEEIRDNYTPKVAGSLDWLMDLERPWDLGRLMILHGEPGTGKTYALRALMMAWRRQFEFLVVTDPERLAANPSYYYQVASTAIKPPRARCCPDDDEENGITFGFGRVQKKRVLFIMEDSADLIITESRSAHYDKINKLLNITDGLIGQGREDVFAITFNEELESIDEAFLRPGRCITKVEFEKFSSKQSTEWLESKGVVYEVPGARTMTLADLYARLLKNPGVPATGAPRSGFSATGGRR